MVCPSFPEVFHEKLDFTTHPRKKEKKSKRYAPTNTLRHKVNTKKKTFSSINLTQLGTSKNTTKTLRNQYCSILSPFTSFHKTNHKQRQKKIKNRKKKNSFDCRVLEI